MYPLYVRIVAPVPYVHEHLLTVVQQYSCSSAQGDITAPHVDEK